MIPKKESDTYKYGPPISFSANLNPKGLPQGGSAIKSLRTKSFFFKHYNFDVFGKKIKHL